MKTRGPELQASALRKDRRRPESRRRDGQQRGLRSLFLGPQELLRQDPEPGGGLKQIRSLSVTVGAELAEEADQRGRSPGERERPGSGPPAPIRSRLLRSRLRKLHLQLPLRCLHRGHRPIAPNPRDSAGTGLPNEASGRASPGRAPPHHSICPKWEKAGGERLGAGTAIFRLGSLVSEGTSGPFCRAPPARRRPRHGACRRGTPTRPRSRLWGG